MRHFGDLAKRGLWWGRQYWKQQTIGGPKMSGNFVRERQRIVYIYNIIYVNNTYEVFLRTKYLKFFNLVYVLYNYVTRC